MSARLQAATASANPILVRLSGASGHGMGTALSERIAHQADVFAFLYRQLGMKAEAQQRRWSASLGVRFFRSQASIAVHAETRADRRILPRRYLISTLMPMSFHEKFSATYLRVKCTLLGSVG